MTFVEVSNLRPGDWVWFVALDHTARRIKINGQVKTWKTRPGNIQVPVKYGMYEYAYIEMVNGEYTFSSPVPLFPAPGEEIEYPA
jgi:hypothetical protein